MGYDIPQKIKYKEIIAFGLTLKQLLIAIPHLALAGYIIFPDYKNPLKIIISAIIILSGFCFTFLELEKHALNFFKFLLLRRADNKSDKLKKYLDVGKLGKNFLELKNKKKLTFLEVEPLSVSLFSELQKEGLALHFQKFLNSLDFPIQIITTTLEKNFEKKFFIIIPEKYNLSIQTKLVMQKLGECGLKTKLLQNYEIIQVFNNFFKNTTENVEIQDFKENYAHYILSPKEIINNKDYLVQETDYSRVISVVGYPRSVNFGFLNKIIKMQEKIDLSIHIEPFSIENLTVKLNSELQKQAADIYSIRNKGGTNPILEIKHSDTRKVLEDLQKGEEKLFQISLYFHCKTKDLKKLNNLTEKVKSELNGSLMIPKINFFTQSQALKSCLPLCQNVLKEQRNITTKPLSAFFPFTAKFIIQDQSGVEFGKNEVNQPIKKDVFKLSNHNGVILASSGGGKSYLTKLLVQRYSKMPEQKIFVIDPEGEYTNIIQELGGQVVTIGLGSQNNINMFDSFGQDLALKKIKLHEIFHMLFPDLGELQKSYLDKGINEIYDKASEENKIPFIGELYYNITQRQKNAVDAVDKRVLAGLIYRLGMFVIGGFSFMNKRTNIELKKDLVCFYLKDLPLFLRSSIMYLIMDFLYVQMKNFEGRKIVFIDEAWSLLSKTNQDTYLFKLIKTCRKYNMGIFLITQEVEDLLNEQTGKSILANSSTTILLRQKESVTKKLSEIFQLNKEEQLHLINANVGSGIAIFDTERYLIKITSNKEEHATIEKPTAREEINPYPDLNINKPYHKFSELTNDKIKYLETKGYSLVSCTPIGQNRSSKFLVKNNKRESSEHTFYVQNMAEEIRKYTNQIVTFETVKPDIIFEFNDIKYAIEFETGTSMTHPERIKEKAKENNRNFGKNWFFVTFWNHVDFYKKFGTTYKILDFKVLLHQVFKKSDVSNNAEKLRPKTQETATKLANL